MGSIFIDPEGNNCYLLNVSLKQNSNLCFFSVFISNGINLVVYAVQTIMERHLSK